MKRDIAAIWIFMMLFQSHTLFSQKVDVSTIRNRYYQATLDAAQAEFLLQTLNEVDHPEALIVAYRGATEAIMAKLRWNLFRKYHFLNQSIDHLNQAVARDPDNVEIRFLRFAVQYHIPGILGFSNALEQDREVIVKNIQRFDMPDISVEIREYIYNFITKTGNCTREELDIIRWKLNQSSNDNWRHEDDLRDYLLAEEGIFRRCL